MNKVLFIYFFFSLAPQISKSVLYKNCGTSFANSLIGHVLRIWVGNLTLRILFNFLFSVFHAALSEAKGSFRVSGLLNEGGERENYYFT